MCEKITVAKGYLKGYSVYIIIVDKVGLTEFAVVRKNKIQYYISDTEIRINKKKIEGEGLLKEFNEKYGDLMKAFNDKKKDFVEAVLNYMSEKAGKYKRIENLKKLVASLEIESDCNIKCEGE